MTAAKPEFVSQNWLADTCGLDRRTVARILLDQGVERSQRGFNRIEAELAISIGHDPVLTAGHASVGRGGVMLAETSSLAAAKAESEEQRARKLRFQNEVAEGLYIRRDQVVREAQDVASDLRNRLSGLGSRLAHQLVGVSDQRAIKVLIDAEVADATAAFHADVVVMIEARK